MTTTFTLSPSAPTAPPLAQLALQPNYVQTPVRTNPSGGDVTGGSVTISCGPGVGASVVLALSLVWGPPGGPPAQVDPPVLLPMAVGGGAQFAVPSGTIGSVVQPQQLPNLTTPAPALVAVNPTLAFAIPPPPPIAVGSACLGLLVTLVSGSGPYTFTVSQ